MSVQRFTFSIIDDISTLEVIFSGELIGTEDFQTDSFKSLVKKIKDAAESKIVFLDLRKVDFWDTEGMRNTVILANDINKKLNDSRVIIVAPLDGYLYARLKEKYENSLANLKWQESVQREF